MKIRVHLITTVAVAIALMAVVAAAALFAERRVIRALALNEGRNLALQMQVALTFHDPSGLPPIVDRPDALNAFIAEAHRRSGRDIVVVNADKIDIGDVPEVQHDVGKRFEHDINNEVGQTLADGIERTYVEISQDYPQGIESLVVPIADDKPGGFRGALILEYTPLLEVAQQRMHEVLWAISICAGLSILVAGSSALLLVRRFTHGMRSLLEGIHALAAGDFKTRVSRLTKDEFGDLARGFNVMAEQIESSRSQLDQQRYVQDIVDSAAEGIVVIDKDGIIVALNPAAAEIIDQTADRLVGRSWLDVTTVRDATGAPFAAGESPIELAITHARRARLELLMVHDDVAVPVIATCNPLREVHGGVVVTLANISHLRRVEREVSQRAEELQLANRELQTNSDATARLVKLGELMQACIGFEEVYAVVETAMPGFFGDMSGTLHLTTASRNLVEEVARWGAIRSSNPQFGPQDCWALRRGQVHRAGHGSQTPRCRHVCNNDPHLAMLCVPLAAQGETLGILHLCHEDEEGTADYIAERPQIVRGVADTIALALANLRLRDALRQQSIRDPNTGLFNRRYLEETGQRELYRVQRLELPLAVMMIDIDHFKRFNDTFGHEAGDMVLKQVSVLLAANCRDSDIPSRYGGEEFALVLPGATLEAGMHRANALRKAVSELHLAYRGRPLGQITVSIGVALYPTDGSDFADLIRNADRMLYRAKREGRNRVIAVADDTGEESEADSATEIYHGAGAGHHMN